MRLFTVNRCQLIHQIDWVIQAGGVLFRPTFWVFIWIAKES